MNIINNIGKIPLHITCKKYLIKNISIQNYSNANLFIEHKNNKKPIESATDNNIKNIVKSMV